jgi:endonuclease-3
VSLKTVIAKLERHYGAPAKTLNDPFELIIWENIAYLVDDQRRAAAFAALKAEVGLLPIDFLAAPIETLTRITKMGGIHPEVRAQRLKEAAQIVLEEFEGDLRNALKLPVTKAMRALKEFPSIGEPGAEKILLFTRTAPSLALDSNGLRVMLRLGFGEEKKSYSASYKSVRDATANEVKDDFDFLISAHLLLKQHGQQTCKQNNPRCDECVLRTHCQYVLTL